MEIYYLVYVKIYVSISVACPDKGGAVQEFHTL